MVSKAYTCRLPHGGALVGKEDSILLTSLSPEERIKAAYARGREAAQILRGELSCWDRQPPDLLHLACDSSEEPFYTTSLHKYFDSVKTGPGGSWDPASVSHGFASISKGEAFCRGAGLSGLPRKADLPGGMADRRESGRILQAVLCLRRALLPMLHCQGGGRRRDDHACLRAPSNLPPWKPLPTGHDGALGPWKLVSVAAIVRGRELKRSLTCLW